MSRLGYLARNPKRSLGALSTLLVAAGLTVGSGAYFTDTDSSLSNSATAATFGITMIGSSDPAFDAFNCDTVANDCNVSTLKDTTADPETNTNDTTFSVSRLVPKDDRTYSRSFGIRNDGNVPAQVRLKALGAGLSEDLLDALKVTVSAQAPTGDAAPTAITADASHLEGINDTLTIPANTTWVYKLTFEFDDNGPQNGLIGDSATITLKAVAVDSNQPDPPADFTLVGDEPKRTEKEHVKARTSRRRMTATIAGCALLAAAGGSGVSFAFFTDPDASTGNSATAGTLELTGISPSANNVLPPAPGKVVRPGGPDATGIQAVGNGGNVPGALTVRVTQVDKLTSNDLAAVLRISVDECTSGTGNTCGDPVSRHDGPLRTATTDIALGSLTPTASKRIRIRVYWRRADDNTALYDDRSGFRLNWTLRTPS